MTGRPPRRREVTTAATAVADAIAWHGLSEELRAQRLVAEWRELVGARIAQRAWPDGVSVARRGAARERVLWVRVVSSAWLHELTLLKDRLAQSLREALGEPPVFDELRFHLGALPAEAQALPGVRERRSRSPARRTPPPPASGAHRRAIEAETAEIADPDLRELIRDVRIRNDR